MDSMHNNMLSSPMSSYSGSHSMCGDSYRSSSLDRDFSSGIDTWRLPQSSSSATNSSGLSLSRQSSSNQPSSQYVCELEIHCQQLTSQNLTLSAENEAIKCTYCELVNTVPSLLMLTNPFNLPVPESTLGTQSSDVLTPLRQEDYRHIKFWLQSNWMSLTKARKTTNSSAPNPRGGSLASQGINTSARFIEDENGKVMMAFASGRIWLELSKSGLAPATWGAASLSVEKGYADEMARRYPELRYCADNWKVNALATLNYPSWWKKAAFQCLVNVSMSIRGAVTMRKKVKTDVDLMVCAFSFLLVFVLTPARPHFYITNPLFPSGELSEDLAAPRTPSDGGPPLNTILDTVMPTPTITTFTPLPPPMDVISPSTISPVLGNPSPESDMASIRAVANPVSIPTTSTTSQADLNAARLTLVQTVFPPTAPAVLEAESTTAPAPTVAPGHSVTMVDPPAPPVHTAPQPKKDKKNDLIEKSDPTWIQKHHGTQKQFKEYWKSIESTVEENCFILASEAAKNAIGTVAAAV
ncbi:hypothetical protein B0H10DRAFT_1967318 [Mycena sp. CBHHK59/15]|nr:hypothetical protein B0H10DRAFT_1967318 [Mycena sp. CBHHK59/15]